MDKYSEILMSFGTKETLNPKIWNDVDTDTPVLKNGIRVALLQIAGEFMDFLGEDLFVDDISGSSNKIKTARSKGIQIMLYSDI